MKHLKIKCLAVFLFLSSLISMVTPISANFIPGNFNPESSIIDPRRAPACGACMNRMDSVTQQRVIYVGTVPCHEGSQSHLDNKYEVQMYYNWICQNCGFWIQGSYHVERTISECPD